MNTTPLTPGTYIIPLIMMSSDVENGVLTLLTVTETDTITVSQGHALAAIAYQEGRLNVSDDIPCFENTPGLWIYPASIDDVPVRADSLPEPVRAHLYGRSAAASDLHYHATPVQQFLDAYDA